MDEQSQNPSSGRKYLTAKEKFSIVKEHLTTKTGVTEICKKYSINATQFYRWQEQFFEGAALGLEGIKQGSASASVLAKAEKRNEEQAREISRLKEVALEIAAENVALKKSPGALSTIK